MGSLVVTIFLTSLLGSMHCAGMCGAFVAFAVGIDGEKPKGRVATHVAYNGGRLVVYITLGVIAGALGGIVDLGGSLVGLQRVAGVLAAVTVGGFGVVWLLRSRGITIGRRWVPPGMTKLLVRGHERAAAMPPVWRALMIGLLTTLLPCGWLYAFVITAAGTGDAVWGGVVMAVFWTGTLPILIGVGAGVRHVTGSLGKALPTVMPLAIIVVALMSIFGRMGLPVTLEKVAAATQGPVPEGAANDGDDGERDGQVGDAVIEHTHDPADAIERLKGLSGAPLPCCDDAAVDGGADEG